MQQTLASSVTTESWQSQLRTAYRDPLALLRALDLEHHIDALVPEAAKDFPMLVPAAFAARMRRGKPDDPLLLQVLPTGEELTARAGFSTDPLNEADQNPRPGLIHKYRGRVLLICASACAINCRYCFRRHFDYSENRGQRDDWREALDYIAADSTIEEVILSGGEPLLLSDDSLAQLIEYLAAIKHVKRLRIHSRLPVVLPARISPTLLRVFEQCRFQPVLVIHCNHPQEVDAAVAEALLSLSQAGCRLLNQAVLLRDVNDSAPTLHALGSRLWDLQVQPYYLHLLDPVQGTGHFDVSQHEAQSIYRDLCALAPGYTVPRLVREVAGEASKIPLGLQP